MWLDLPSVQVSRIQLLLIPKSLARLYPRDDFREQCLARLRFLFLVEFFCPSQQGFPCGSAGKESACNAGDRGSIPGLGRSPGKGKGYPLQYSGLENSMDCIVHGVTKSQTWLREFHFTVEASAANAQTSITLTYLQFSLRRALCQLPWRLID